MKRTKSFWIKERYNPQLGTYFVPEGQLSKAAARKAENALYGSNKMHEYATEEEYNKAIADLKAQGLKVH